MKKFVERRQNSDPIRQTLYDWPRGGLGGMLGIFVYVWWSPFYIFQGIHVRKTVEVNYAGINSCQLQGSHCHCTERNTSTVRTFCDFWYRSFYYHPHRLQAKLLIPTGVCIIWPPVALPSQWTAWQLTESQTTWLIIRKVIMGKELGKCSSTKVWAKGCHPRYSHLLNLRLGVEWGIRHHVPESSSELHSSFQKKPPSTTLQESERRHLSGIDAVVLPKRAHFQHCPFCLHYANLCRAPLGVMWIFTNDSLSQSPSDFPFSHSLDSFL